MITKQINLINESSDTLIFDAHEIAKPGEFFFGPTLWCRQGSFCIIPQAVLMNILDNAEDYAAMDSDKTINPKLKIIWSQGILISNLAGRTLMGE